MALIDIESTAAPQGRAFGTEEGAVGRGGGLVYFPKPLAGCSSHPRGTMRTKDVRWPATRVQDPFFEWGVS